MFLSFIKTLRRLLRLALFNHPFILRSFSLLNKITKPTTVYFLVSGGYRAALTFPHMYSCAHMHESKVYIHAGVEWLGFRIHECLIIQDDVQLLSKVYQFTTPPLEIFLMCIFFISTVVFLNFSIYWM